MATALPDLDFEQDFRRWARGRVAGTRAEKVYERMAARSGIDHRWSVLDEQDAKLHQGEGLYGDDDAPPSTAARMELYAKHAPELALKAVGRLPELGDITHLVVASCTGFVAPGIDQIIARRLGLGAHVERVLIGFMGCYAAVTSLRTARHIVRSQPDARVLVVTVELSSLHHQSYEQIEPLMAVSQFGDGAAAALVTGAGEGLALGDPLSVELEQSDELIRWHIGDTGFEMHLSGEVPGRIRAALQDEALRVRITEGHDVGAIEAWAVHAGGRSILDAVEGGLGLGEDALRHSREVLRTCGNMSSSTLMFVLERAMQERPASGVALAFGPGLAMEGLRFRWQGA
ncbi:MAG: type III polyketide synthase [Alteripontixanthobacter sp.]